MASNNMPNYNGRANAYNLWMNVWENWASTELNRSSVHWEIGISSNGVYSVQALSAGCVSVNAYVNGTHVYGANPAIGSVGSFRIAQGDLEIAHDDEGHKTVNFSCSWRVISYAGVSSAGYAPGNGDVSGSTKLTDIARASDFGTITSDELGNEVTVNISRKVNSFTHNVQYRFGDGNSSWSDWVVIDTNAATSISFTPKLSLAKLVPNDTKGILHLWMATYNGTTQIGSAKEKKIDLNVPESIVPTMSTPSITRVDNGVPSTFGVYVQGYSKVTIGITNPAGAYGSTIKNYSIVGPSISSTTQTATSSILTNTGIQEYVCTLTDSRGRTVTKTVSINVVAYSRPSFRIVSAVRCNSDGSLNNTGGTYLRITSEFSISSVSGKNSIISKYIKCNNQSNLTSFSSGVSFIYAANLSTNSTGQITGSITDALGNSASASFDISVAFRIFNINQSKKGLAIGKICDADEFQVGIPTKIMQSYYAGYKLTHTTNDPSWINLGTWAFNDNGSVLSLRVYTGNYDVGTAKQNTEIDIMVKNLSSSNIDKAYSVTWEQRFFHRNEFKVQARAISTSSISIWIYIPNGYGSGFYISEFSSGIWEHKNTVQTTEPTSGTAQDCHNFLLEGATSIIIGEEE